MATDVGMQEEDAVGEINKYDFRTTSNAVFKARKGIDAEMVGQISEMKGEPDWMREFRHRSLDLFLKAELPEWLPGPTG